VISLPITRHRFWQLVVDGVLVAAAWYLAFRLRFDPKIPPYYHTMFTRTIWIVLLIQLSVFILFGFYNRWWRYVSTRDMWGAGRGVTVACLVSSVVVYFANPVAGVRLPRSVAIMDWLLLLAFVAGARMLARTLMERPTARGLVARGREVIVVGAGDAAQLIIKELLKSPSLGYTPIGLVDDDPRKKNLRVHNVRVLGTTEELSRILHENRPDEVLIAIPHADTAAVRAVVRTLEPFKVPIKTLPNLREIIDGRVDVAQIRGLAFEDLLVRAPVGLDRGPLKRLIAGRRVMVTGAGGSIGSELCRQIAQLKPAALVMLDRYENTLHAIRVELDAREHVFGVIPVIGDVTDASRVNALLAEHQPEIIFHAAAHKHVPLMEENPCEAVKNNVGGTRVLAQSADAFGVDHFIMISTDKAVNPTSIMGASKRIAELVVQAQAAGSGTTFSIVRFGNVLGSNGSVVPHFMEQIRRGGPVTVTDPEIRRFFMLIPEAVQLVLHAAAQAENGATYVLEMGEQVKLLDMARNLIRLSGFIPDEDIKIVFTGLRPGEKLYEELVGAGEDASASSVEKVLCVRSRASVDPEMLTRVKALLSEALRGRTVAVLAAIKELVGTFQDADGSTAAGPEPLAPPPPAASGVNSHDEQPCPECGTGRAHRSRARSAHERLKKAHTAHRLFKCDSCGWRGWLVPLAPGAAPVEVLQPPDWATLDSDAKLRPVERRQNFSPRNLR